MTTKQQNDSHTQVNNATARVVTKKPQTPLVNGECLVNGEGVEH